MTEKDIKKRIKERACLQEVTGGEIPEDMKKGIRNLPDRTRSLGKKNHYYENHCHHILCF